MNKTETVAPHPPLTDYYADETARHRWLRTVFNASAVDYDRIEGLMAFGTGPWYRRQALRRAGLGAGHAGTRCGYRYRTYRDPGRTPDW